MYSFVPWKQNCNQEKSNYALTKYQCVEKYIHSWNNRFFIEVCFFYLVILAYICTCNFCGREFTQNKGQQLNPFCIRLWNFGNKMLELLYFITDTLHCSFTKIRHNWLWAWKRCTCIVTVNVELRKFYKIVIRLLK